MKSAVILATFCAVFALPLCFSFPLDNKDIFYLESNATDSPANAQYTYSQSSGRFQGKAYDGGYIDVTGCSGAQGSCRNNPSCQCKVAIGPLPRARCVDASFSFEVILCSPGPAATQLVPKSCSRACPPAMSFFQTQEICAEDPASSFTAATARATPARAALSYQMQLHGIAFSTAQSFRSRSSRLATARPREIF
jgi:hypothetical protein